MRFTIHRPVYFKSKVFNHFDSFSKYFFFCPDNADYADTLSLGLSKSEVEYLQVTSQPTTVNDDHHATATKVPQESDTGALVLSSPSKVGFNDIAVVSNNQYSGVLQPNHPPSPTMDTAEPLQNAENQFVQVASQGSLNVLASDVSEKMEVVGNQFNSILSYSSLTPTITTQVTDISQVTNVLNLQQASINSTVSTVENLPLISFLQCPPAKIDTTTTNTGQVYLLELRVDEDEDDNTKSIIGVLDELQCASTPKTIEDETATNFNDTILAGNLNAANIVATPVVVSEPVNNENIQSKFQEEEKHEVAEIPPNEHMSTGVKQC